jgi:hypothetical protein
MIRINKLDKSYFQDPRSFSSDGRMMTFGDDGVTNGKVCLNDIHTGYYDSYADIRAGQIAYYIDKEVQRPFPSQLFNLKNSKISYEDYIDPNGVHKPHRRIMYNDSDNHLPSSSPFSPSSQSCLSFIKDTQTFRNDILSSHMWRRHQEEYENHQFV